MRTKQLYMNNKGYLLMADGSKSAFWFDYESKEKRYIQPFGQPVADNSMFIKTTTQLLFKVDDSVFIKDNRSRIINIKVKPLNEKRNKRSFVERKEYYIELS